MKDEIKNICKKILPDLHYTNLKVDKEILKDLIKSGYSLYEIEQSVRDKFIELIDDTELEHKERDADNKKNLDNEYKRLDKILYCSIGQPIKLGINEDMVGSYEYNYILKDYRINGIYNSITLELERKGDDYKISFIEIQDIDWNGTKVWLKSKDTNWRFYHKVDVDNTKLSSLGENFKSKKIELQEDIQIYMQYKDVNNLLYHVEKQKYENRYFEMDITQKEITDKLDNKMILLNILDKESSNKRQGTIYAYSDSGRQGIFHYELREEELYIFDMLPDKKSQGVGSKVLELMEETALRYNIKELSGMLSTVDFDHKERLLYFYKKNGFIVNDSESGIRKKLN
ncbi:GNAT family N-acetyltransferase [Clostridium sp. FP1]|uniref:GNAT family N-acetyltransferase n=1 Tax=Clostridium sp. FP1 TaxID=2724076 RepID=UPI0013E918E5|nr:GNAT family N-acetyltransferase [Clostridium sp. FP1]MBZ9633050.1 hypothetical protein [Clostridium sp. FP1]